MANPLINILIYIAVLIVLLIVFYYIFVHFLKRFLNKEKKKEKEMKVCPICESKNIVKTDVGISEPVFARGVHQQQYKCLDCGYTSMLIGEEK